MRKLLSFVSIFALFLLSGACAVNPVTGEQDLVLLTEDDEIALGRKANAEVLKQYAVYDNPALQNYVQEIGQRLANNSHRSNLVYRFTVLDSKEVNAFALPGGYIYITRGLMAYLRSEAELAAVLGHEIGHVTARHSVRQYSAQQLTGIGLALGSILIPGMDQSTNQLAEMFGVALLRGYGREHELEADRLGAEYLARTNYNPQAMLDVIGVLKDQEVFESEVAQAEGREPRTYHGVFSTHPDNDTRLQEVVATASALANNSGTGFVGREEYLTYTDGLVYGDSPREGIQRGQNFYHEDLGFAMTFPANWNVTNLPDRVMLTSPGGMAQIQIGAEDINRKLSPRQFMIDRLGLTNLTNESYLNINGLDAHTGVSVIRTSYGQRPTRFNVVYHRQKAYIIAGMTKDANQLVNFDAAIIEVAKSFRDLSEAERALAKPLRIKVIEADSNTRFSSLAADSPLENHVESHLRLLNGRYSGGEPAAGELIKIIE